MFFKKTIKYLLAVGLISFAIAPTQTLNAEIPTWIKDNGPGIHAGLLLGFATHFLIGHETYQQNLKQFDGLSGPKERPKTKKIEKLQAHLASHSISSPLRILACIGGLAIGEIMAGKTGIVHSADFLAGRWL